MQSGQTNLTPEKLKVLSVQMRKRLAEGPPELRQAYMRLILDTVMVDHHEVHLDGPPVILEKLARAGAINALPEVLSFAQEWRAAVVKRENWVAKLKLPRKPGF